MNLSPQIVQIALFILVALSVAGVLVSLLLPLFQKNAKSSKRLGMAVNAGSSTDGRSGTSEERTRRRSVEAVQREFEQKQKAKASKRAKVSLSLQLRRAGLSWSKQTYWIVGVVIGIVTFFIAYVLAQLELLPSVAFGGAAIVLGPKLYVARAVKTRQKKFANEFPNAMDVITRGVKAGLPLMDCLKVISRDAQEPVRSEFKAVVDEQALGVPVDEALKKLTERMPLAETNFFTIVIAIQSRSGGSLAEALGNLSKVLRDRKKMQAKIVAMSQEAKSSAGIIGALPIVVATLVYLTTPDYIALLWTTTTGNIVLVCSGLWMGTGIAMMKKMINFDF